MPTCAPAFGTFGRTRTVRVQDLRAGQMVIDPVYGRAGHVLIYPGEVLSQKHVDFIQELIKKPGEGCLLHYTREVQARTARGSERLRPEVDFDPYKSIAVQQWYKRHK